MPHLWPGEENNPKSIESWVTSNVFEVTYFHLACVGFSAGGSFLMYWGVMKVMTIFVYVPLGHGPPVQCWNMRQVARFGQEREGESALNNVVI